MKLNNLLLTACAVCLLAFKPALSKQIKIGIAVDDLRLDRWQKDRDIFVRQAKFLSASMFIQSANGNEETQMSQIENMINCIVDVLVIIHYNGQMLASVITEDKQK